MSCWIQHLIPKIEDGNDFGVAIQVHSVHPLHTVLQFDQQMWVFNELQMILSPQEKILERIAAIKTKVDGFQTNINK